MSNVETEKWTKEEAVKNIMDSIGDVSDLCSDIVNRICDNLREKIEPHDIISEQEVERLAAEYVAGIDLVAVEAGQFYDDVVRDEIYAAVKREVKAAASGYFNG